MIPLIAGLRLLCMLNGRGPSILWWIDHFAQEEKRDPMIAPKNEHGNKSVARW
jgi:hypothetical protein